MRSTSLALVLALSAASLALLPAFRPAPAPLAPGWKVVAWNDLGMHCMDSDYSVFSILPPFNVVWAQLIDPSGNLVTSEAGYTLTYEAVADPTGSINKSSAGKTNYWTYANALYGASGVPDTGLVGFDMPGPANTPRPMAFDASQGAWIATGIPITPTSDAGHVRTYPLMKIVARDAGGALLASATPVLPVSSEMDCRACHASGSGPDAEPAGGWVDAKLAERDYRLNILKLHDERQLGTPAYDAALATLDMVRLAYQGMLRGRLPLGGGEAALLGLLARTEHAPPLVRPMLAHALRTLLESTRTTPEIRIEVRLEAARAPAAWVQDETTLPYLPVYFYLCWANPGETTALDVASMGRYLDTLEATRDRGGTAAVAHTLQSLTDQEKQWRGDRGLATEPVWAATLERLRRLRQSLEGRAGAAGP